MDNKIKPSYDENRQILGEIYPLSTPFTVILDASEACNFNCSYCFRSFNDTKAWGDYAIKKNLMSWDVFQCAVNQIKEFPEDIKKISLSCHGEPLCNRKLPQMVKYIKEQGLKCQVSIHTNASLLDKEYAEELASSGIDKIIVSLQGLDASAYKQVCGVDISFDEFYSNLKYLYDHKLSDTKIHIKIIDVAVGNKCDEFYDKFSPIADSVYIEKEVSIWKKTEEKRSQDVVYNKYGIELNHQNCCTLLFNTLVVTPDGDVYPCTQIISREKLGNIKDTSLVQLWNGDQRKDLLKRQLLLCPPEECNGCGIKQNSIFVKEDMIDDYRFEILDRLGIR